jgi:hypothetical protein
VGQTGAALRTAAGQNLATIAGGHTLAETMFLGTLALLGLIGTKHGGHLLIQFKAGLPGSTTACFSCGLHFYNHLPMCFPKNGHKNPFFKKALSIIDDFYGPCQLYFFVFDCSFFLFSEQTQYLVPLELFAYHLYYTFK